MRGSWLAKTRDGEPLPPKGRPDPPDWLDELALQEWRKIVPLLESMGVLTLADGDALANYCSLWACYQRCYDWVRRYGEVQAGEKSAQRWPQARALCEYTSQLSRLRACFGLTPADRASMNVAPQDRPDSIEAWLAG